MGKTLKYLVIHCTATREGQDITGDNIRDWHTSPKPRGNGWKKVGYSDLILLDGRLESLTPFDTDDDVEGWEITNGAKGFNDVSRHICYVGGLDNEMKTKDTRTLKQKITLETYVRYMLLRHPGLKVIGHNEISNKDCPSFDVPEWLDNQRIT